MYFLLPLQNKAFIIFLSTLATPEDKFKWREEGINSNVLLIIFIYNWKLKQYVFCVIFEVFRGSQRQVYVVSLISCLEVLLEDEHTYS